MPEGGSFRFYPEVLDYGVRKFHLFFLGGTVFFGSLFIWLQVLEFSRCSVHIGDSSSYRRFFGVVGLHLMHVFVGITGLCLFPLFFGSRGVLYYASVISWYWHFVDYV